MLAGEVEMSELAQRAETPVIQDETPAGKIDDTSYGENEKPLEISEHIKELWKIGDASEHFEMPVLIKEIDDFILSEIKRDGKELNYKSYEEILSKYEKKLNLPENIDIYTKTELLNELIRIDKKLIEAMLEKEELEKKPIEELTSKQLRKRIEECKI